MKPFMLALALALGLGCSDDGAAPAADSGAGADQKSQPADGAASDSAPASGKLTSVASFGSNPGDLLMQKYQPGGALKGKRPLVVVLHGCGETAAGHSRASGWRTLADRKGLYLALPGQKLANNIAGCFNWFSAADQARGKGEALSIKQMVDHMRAAHPIDGKRIYVAGLSAGGGMTAVMLATYPDLFAGGAIMAGVPYGCAADMLAGQTCLGGVDKTPKAWGDLARKGFGGHKGPWPVVALFHGDKDGLVSAVNLTELTEQWTAASGADAKADKTSTVSGHTRKAYTDGKGRTVVVSYLVSGMGHALPVDPGSKASQGGEVGTFYHDADLWGPWEAARLWGI